MDIDYFVPMVKYKSRAHCLALLLVKMYMDIPTSGTTLSSVPLPCDQCTYIDMTCVEVGTQIHGCISSSNITCNSP